MTGDESQMPGKWIDTEAGVQRAEHRRHEAGMLASILRANEEFWNGIGERNSFRSRWAAATRRDQR